MIGDRFQLGVHEFNGYQTVVVRAGRKRTERIVPPAGEEYAFDRDIWDHEVQISVSPAGRSVRVFIDGVEARAQENVA